MALTEPDFIERDADKITAEMIASMKRIPAKRCTRHRQNVC